MDSRGAQQLCLWATIVLWFCPFLVWAAVGVLPLQVDHPWPTYSGESPLVLHLQADPADPNVATLSAFRISNLNLAPGQRLQAHDPDAHECSGPLLASGDTVATHGLLCLWSLDESSSDVADSESTFAYAAINALGVEGPPETVTVVTYDLQACPTIPDFGPSGFIAPPSIPFMNVVQTEFDDILAFEVVVPYIRNGTAWHIDFFDFDGRPEGDSATSTGRTCSNHHESSFSGLHFSQWWWSQPRADFALPDPTAGKALNNRRFPMHNSGHTRWRAENVGCDKVKYTAAIPAADLVSPAGCRKTGLHAKPVAAATGSGSRYTASLYVIALRPRDPNSDRAGYFKATYIRPFSFVLSEPHEGKGGDKEAAQLAHHEYRLKVHQSRSVSLYVTVVDMRVTLGTSLSLQLETTMQGQEPTSPDVGDFSLEAYPNSALRVAAGKAPQLWRVSDNGKCNVTTADQCVIVWQVVIPELTSAQAGGVSAYNHQYVGLYSFSWRTTSNDSLSSDLTIYAVAANATDLGELSVMSGVDFFSSAEAMVNTSASGLSLPTFSAGAKIWVRHSIAVGDTAASAYRLHLQTAWVCWSPVPGFAPSVNPGTGCSQDIPGVIEARLGQRFLLYNASSGGIGDDAWRAWGWTLVGPTNTSWSGGHTAQNGFGINADAIAPNQEASNHTYFFHLVSAISQTPLATRNSNHQRSGLTATVAVASRSSALGGVRVIADTPVATSSASHHVSVWWRLLWAL